MVFFRKIGGRSGSSDDDAGRKKGEHDVHESRQTTDDENSVLLYAANLDSHVGDLVVDEVGELPPTPIHHHDEKKWRRRCSLLERCIQEYDVEEHYYQERIQSLERQVERLLFARTAGADDVGDCSDYLHRSISAETNATAPLSPSSSLQSLPEYSAKQDIASLEELLSKVLAENKVLTSKVESLTAILKETPQTTGTTTLPSTITDLDSAVALNACTPITTSDEEPTTYVLRCKKSKACKKFHYKGQVNGDLLLKVNEHHEDIWRKINNEYRKKKKKKKSEPVKYASNEFGRSSFAEHVADHLYKAKSLDEVQKWCKSNVQILKKI